ncbi:imidazole glycerol phosphate synthase subunit HisH [Candidatus Synechococcus calcipolaris G9]|uniref:Imidazole glycerol phosphate synthase subunit HisH n=1 Tax=Candidatus Synechococcus calcipolaris G9 TaxID=1497997 RepID=A0ABT6F3C6_9SYNE|nr:imidazole glycerol phosphate synthase subunit HisH [Candidatus Synechococcus calcipolaris]MDG2992381.1 imidazole glycerol phosphate synthase subunit HisH [Candidatus Synechococcus calcipolaris G9]
MSTVAVIDYGIGNLLSVQRGLEYCGANVEVTSNPKHILSAARVVLPGVGAFGNAMAELQRRHLVEVVHEVVNAGIPFLGICLGMQLLLSESEEFGLTQGLNLIPGRVIPVPKKSTAGIPQKIPHIGWSNLVLAKSRSNWNDTILSTISLVSSVYFVHSFMAVTENKAHRIADCIYGGISIPAVVARDNIYGCQFHPEKSGEIGLKILQQFIAL